MICWECRVHPVTVRVRLRIPLVSIETRELCESCCGRWLHDVGEPAVFGNARIILTRKLICSGLRA
jgi:hypothetical protein